MKIKLNKNHFIIETEESITFTSYDVIVAKIEYGQLYLDVKYYRYSSTTNRRFHRFLHRQSPEIIEQYKNIKAIMKNLN